MAVIYNMYIYVYITAHIGRGYATCDMSVCLSDCEIPCTHALSPVRELIRGVLTHKVRLVDEPLISFRGTDIAASNGDERSPFIHVRSNTLL